MHGFALLLFSFSTYCSLQHLSTTLYLCDCENKGNWCDMALLVSATSSSSSSLWSFWRWRRRCVSAAQISSDTWTLTVVSIRTIVHAAAAASVTARISKNICPYTQTQTTSAVNCVVRHSGITGKWKLTWQKNRELVIGLSNGECMSSLLNMCVRVCSLIQDAYCYLFIWYSVF